MKTHLSDDIAIVGYGPTSQLLTLLLGRKGHRVTVVERWPDLYPLPRAVHFDHEVARMLQAAGVIDDVNRIVERADNYQWRNAECKTLLDFDWRGMGPSGWPISNMFSQPDLERLLDGHIKRLPNIRVLQGYSATTIKQDAQGVQIDIEGGQFIDGKWTRSDETSTVHAKYLIGADGANSMVRNTLGIETHDLGFAFDWLVVDVKPGSPRDWTPKTWQLCDPARPTTIIPSGPGRRRWEFMLLPGEKAEDMNRDAVAWDLLKRWDIHPQNAVLERHAVYTFRGQWAMQWRLGRVLLAGDAAHLMPPFAGQGLCSGMRDSIALAWRLDAILRGKVSDAVLDSYGPERSGHVQEMIEFSVQLGKVICITDPEVAAGRDRDMLAAQASPDYKAPESPRPRLGAGVYQKNSTGSGLLMPQGHVISQDRSGLFDDVFGLSFALITKDQATLDSLSQINLEALKAYGAVMTHIGPGGMEDVDGVYNGYLAEQGSIAVLSRPDFYSFGSARTTLELNSLIDAWRDSLQMKSWISRTNDDPSSQTPPCGHAIK